MTLIYILEETINWDGQSRILGAYTTVEKAYAARDKWIKADPDHNQDTFDYSIDCVELDNE